MLASAMKKSKPKGLNFGFIRLACYIIPEFKIRMLLQIRIVLQNFVCVMHYFIHVVCECSPKPPLRAQASLEPHIINQIIQKT